MIYICVPSQNNGETVGLLLWKIRKVMQEFPRAYHILVADDCSDDQTQEVLEPYQRSLPLTVIRHPNPRGYAVSVEMLLRNALRRSDRPKRDCAVTIDGDFSTSPEAIPEFIKRFESGVDVVIGEPESYDGPFAERLLRRSSSYLLRPGVRIPGVRDFLGRSAAFRLITVKKLLKEQEGRLLETEDICAHVELVARTAAVARQLAIVPLFKGPGKPPETSRFDIAMQLFRAGRKLSIPAPTAEVQRAS